MRKKYPGSYKAFRPCVRADVGINAFKADHRCLGAQLFFHVKGGHSEVDVTLNDRDVLWLRDTLSEALSSMEIEGDEL